MKPFLLAPDIHYVGLNDRTTTRFEALWSLPYGVSYNSYLIVDEKVALIDTVDGARAEEFLDRIREVLGDRPVDYLVVNHMEPDHSSSVRALRRAYPRVQIVGNAKTFPMLEGYYGIKDGLFEVKEGDSLSLGRRSLSFYMIPMVHWPETMVSYCKEDELIFTGDALGTFGALNGGVRDVDLNLDHFWDEMRRYYACIVGKYGAPVQAALAKLGGLNIRTACPTHGPVWTRELPRVLEIYDKLSRYEGDPGVVIAYGSMYGNTARMAEDLAAQMSAAGVRNIWVYDLSHADISVVLRDVFKYDTLIVGSPTYNAELFPEVEYLLQKLEARQIPHRKFAWFGSYNWAGAAVRKLNDFATRMGWEVICPPVEMQRGYDDADASACREQAGEIAGKLK